MQNKLAQEQRFGQKMALTPQMRQSINILAMSADDLAEYVDMVAAHNPFLQKILEASTAEKYRSRARLSGENDRSGIENTVTQKENPRFQLLSLFRMAADDDVLAEIAEYLFFEMDDNGYIDIDIGSVASDLGVSEDEVLDCIRIIQEMEPAGIGACGVAECLQLQLKRKGMADSLEYRIVSSYLGEVARDEFERIAKVFKEDVEKVKAAVANIKKLNPKPASTLLAKESEKVIPDLRARVTKEKVQLEVNRGAVPGLKLYNPYENDFNIVKDPEARKFMKDNINAAKHLIGNLKRREETVCKVADYVLSHQLECLTEEKKSVKPLTIGDIARALDFHPSTVSRTLAHKHVMIDDRVVPLKSLLSHSITTEAGEVLSKKHVKSRIEALVRSEDRHAPVTDDDITRKLNSEGVPIRRRTVAKYRTALGILPVHLRRKARVSL